MTCLWGSGRLSKPTKAKPAIKPVAKVRGTRLEFLADGSRVGVVIGIWGMGGGSAESIMLLCYNIREPAICGLFYEFRG